MYRLMMSKKVTLDHPISGLMSSYRQTEVGHFQQFRSALRAYYAVNKKGRLRCYLLNALDQEYYEGTWID